MPNLTPAATDAAPVDTLSPDDFDALDAILDDLRSRHDEIPQWEFCEGFMAALAVCRRPIDAAEAFPALLDLDYPAPGEAGGFSSAEQAQQFVTLWTRRWNDVVRSLSVEVKSLDDETAYHPEVMDVRGAVAVLPEEDRAAMGDQELPSFAQVWALGFMFAVETWPEEWAAPRDKEAEKWLDAALQSIVALTEDDTAEPTISVFDDDGPPSVSEQRINDFADALWAVYDLRELWSSF
ncbi:MAG: YecA family protein, partial [Burkholderiaceae bacterium]|nr:YecA family protein [Burkholderiaceae bacterium]